MTDSVTITCKCGWSATGTGDWAASVGELHRKHMKLVHHRKAPEQAASDEDEAFIPFAKGGFISHTDARS